MVHIFPGAADDWMQTAVIPTADEDAIRHLSFVIIKSCGLLHGYVVHQHMIP